MTFVKGVFFAASIALSLPGSAFADQNQHRLGQIQKNGGYVEQYSQRLGQQQKNGGLTQTVISPRGVFANAQIQRFTNPATGRNYTVVVQAGRNNSSAIAQSGNSNSARIIQRGNNTNVRVNQNGNNNISNVLIFGVR